MVLEVGQTATLELVTRSYKRLALKLHPDRNANHDSTEAFQLVCYFLVVKRILLLIVQLWYADINRTLKLGKAYETLKDESKRRAYDLIYPSITRSHPSHQTTQTPRPHPASAPQSGALSHAAQIAALQKLKQERGARWRIKKNAFESSIVEQQRDTRRLEQEIKNLDSILAAEAAEEAQKRSWGTWLLSPIYKKREDSEEEKARKDRGRQERRIEKDMKERRLGLKKADLRKEESLLRKAKEAVDAADLVDNEKIREIQDMIWAIENWERQKRERAEKERAARIWKQQQEQWQKREREAAERVEKLQVEERAAEQKRQEERAQKRQEIFNDEQQASRTLCGHDGWWPKVQGRTACPECHDTWNYLLQCPGCRMKACPKCQYTIRHRWNRRAPPRMRTPITDYSYDYF
jgi:hypothetical protein